MKSSFLLLSVILSFNTFCHQKAVNTVTAEIKDPIVKRDTLSLLFIGDIMGHGPQIESALNSETGLYDYNGVFSKVSGIIKKADFAIANLEVTLAGEPYMGYPQFSSPDALAMACKNNGIDALVTANNHSCDRLGKGILRTINILDSFEIRHTGTFKNAEERLKKNLMVFERNNIKVGILNYTYGTNGIPAPEPTIVNLIDTTLMLSDIQKSKESKLDKLIVFIHWGIEYQSHPSVEQIKIANFLQRNGVDIVIGSHPHVLQKMEYTAKSAAAPEHFIVYSLGNYVSNQRDRKKDGGAMVELTLTKSKAGTTISKAGYHLTWVDRPIVNGKMTYEILPCAAYEAQNFEGLDEDAQEKMKLFMSDSRALLGAENVGVGEVK